jgi:drug/metabolite transporter superfamily protein YnfA
MLHLPLAALPYRLAQFLGLFAQWLLLLGTGWLWLRAGRTRLMNWLIALIVMAFTFTASWRLHADRGQSYVVLAFLFAYWLTATLDPRPGNGFLAGCIAGFLVALRPPFLLLMPFLALHRRGQLTGAAVGLLLGFGLPMLMNPACWTNYFSAMQVQSDFYRHGFKSPPNHQTYPATIEGVPIDVMRHLTRIPAGEFSVHELLRRLGLEPFPVLPPFLALAAAFALWLGLSRGQPAVGLLPGMAAWLFLIDLFLPAFRESYNDVLILNVAAAGLAFAPRFPWEAWPCILALPLGVAVDILNPPHPWIINLPVALFTLSAVLFLFRFNNRAAAPAVKPHLK